MARVERYKDHVPRIDPTAFVHEDATLIGQVEVGAEATIWPGVVMRGDDGLIKIGARTSIQDGSVVHMTRGLSEVGVGERVTVGHNVILHGCKVEDDCLIGMGAILLDNCVIGTGSLIAAGALVTVGKVIPPNSVVMGNPGKIVRTCQEKDRAMIDHGWREYVERGKEYLARDAAGLSSSLD